jgi:hypothetical protein
MALGEGKPVISDGKEGIAIGFNDIEEFSQQSNPSHPPCISPSFYHRKAKHKNIHTNQICLNY